MTIEGHLQVKTPLVKSELSKHGGLHRIAQSKYVAAHSLQINALSVQQFTQNKQRSDLHKLVLFLQQK